MPRFIDITSEKREVGHDSGKLGKALGLDFRGGEEQGVPLSKGSRSSSTWLSFNSSFDFESSVNISDPAGQALSFNSLTKF